MTIVTAPRSSGRGLARSSTRTRARKPHTTRKMTSEYIRASVAYRTANGELASSNRATHAPGRPPMRRPASHISGKVATAMIPPSDRTARSLVPNNRIHPWSSR